MIKWKINQIYAKNLSSIVSTGHFGSGRDTIWQKNWSDYFRVMTIIGFLLMAIS